MNLSVSTVAWDGHSYKDALASMTRLGIARIEWAFIDGYMDPFSDADLNAAHATYLRERMADFGQSSPVLSAHIDGGSTDAVTRLETRLHFAHGLGACWLITNAADQDNGVDFRRNLKHIRSLAHDLGIRVCFDNPGNASNHLINSADDLPNFLATLDRHEFGINYDAGNLVSHRPDIDPESDLDAAQPYCDHLHLKAVRRSALGYEFGVPGAMSPDYARALVSIARRDLAFSLELPFRLRRDFNGVPRRAEHPLSIDRIEHHMADALRWVAHHYPNYGLIKSQGASHDPA